MATVQEHMLADFSRALQESGRDVVIDGVPVKAFTKDLEPAIGTFMGQSVVRIAYWLQSDILSPLPPIGAEIEIDGTLWIVELAIRKGLGDYLIVQRNIA